MNKRSNLLLYLLINILVSAATTLVVLYLWDYMRKSGEPVLPQQPAQSTPILQAAPPQQDTVVSAKLATSTPALPTATPLVPQATAGPTETDLPADAKLIEIVSIVGAGDLQQEVVLLKRTGEGNLRMVGWKLEGERNNMYKFPEQPELILYKDGAVQVYTGAGTDTVTEVYWNRSEAAWRPGEMVRLLDPQGNERATFRVP